MSTLYEIVEDLEILEANLEHSDATGEMDEMLLQQVMSLLDTKVEERNVKLDSYAYVVKKLQAEADIARAEARAWTEKAQHRERRIRWLKQCMVEALQRLGEQKIETQRFKFSVQSNPPAVSVVNAEVVPRIYFDQPEPVVSLQRIRADIDAGIAVPGVIQTIGSHLRIR